MAETSRTILVAADGSPAARAAAFAAMQIATALDLVVRGLYVVDEILTLDTYADYQAELGSMPKPISHSDLLARFEQHGTAILRQFEAECRAKGISVSVEMELGGVSEVVLRQSAQAQLLALGRRGHRHARDSGHLGSNFRAIAHQTHLPMLVGGDSETPLRRLLLAYNGSPHSQEALLWTARLQEALPVEILILAVEEDGADLAPGWLEAAKTSLEQCGLAHCQFLTRRGQPAAEIVAAADEQAADLIIMGGYRHKALLEWVIGSTVDRVLRGTPRPVLVA